MKKKNTLLFIIVTAVAASQSLHEDFQRIILLKYFITYYGCAY